MKKLLLVAGVMLCSAPCHAWWPAGHSILSEAAVRALPEEMPQFFREGGKAVAHHSQDPDVAKNRAAPLSTSTEAPEHYFDWELVEKPLGDKPFPATRYDYLKFCFENGVAPQNVGLVPYAVAEWTERLTVAFAEYRRWPKNKRIREQCLISAGILAHYAQDLCQPLHTTLHHDGRAKEDGSSPRSGIHNKIDALVETLAPSPKILAQGQAITPLNQLLPDVVREMRLSHELVDAVYALEAKLPVAGQKPAQSDSELLSFTNLRARAATRFAGSLFLTAWHNSAQVQLPEWLKRENK